MATPLRLLLIEDDEDDARFIVRELQRGGYDPSWERVDTAAALHAALEAQTWDAITCDWIMPGFSAPLALGILREHGISVPTIIISGEVGEEVLVSAMRAGAHDFVSKSRLARLVPAMERELRDAEIRRERQRAETALAARLEVVTAAKAGFWEWDLGAASSQYAASWRRLLGYSEVALGDALEAWLVLVHPDDRDRLGTYVGNYLCNPIGPYEIEFRIRDSAGVYRWILSRAIAVCDEQGQVKRLLGLHVDITDRQRLEAGPQGTADDEVRSRVDQRCRAVIEMAVDFGLVLDLAGHIRYVSPSLLDALGRTNAELEGCEVFDLVHPEDAARVRSVFADVAATPGATATSEIRVGRPDGAWVIVEARMKNLLSDPAVGGVLVNAHDISARRRAEVQLHEHSLQLELRHDLYRAIQEGKSIPEVLRDVIGRIRRLVPSDLVAVLLFDGETGDAQVIGGIADPSVGVEKIRTIPRSDFSPAALFLENPILNIDELATREAPAPIVEQLRAAGLHSLLNASLIDDGQLLGVVSFAAKQPAAFGPEQCDTARDLAGLLAIGIHQARLLAQVRRNAVELEQRVHYRTAQLEAANKELETFSYSVSHDLRAPLRHIEGFSRILIEEFRANLPAEGQGYLDRIRAGTRHMAELIEELLGLAQVTRTAMVTGPVDLSELARSVIADLRAADPQRTVEVLIAPTLVTSGDAPLLRTLLTNLLGNAWKYTGKHATARIEFGAVNGAEGVVYFVRDDGAGFDMAYAQKLFGAFQRLHTPSEFEGTGIGLATVRRIVHRHGGRVWAEGKPDRGATFYFTLAALPEDELGGAAR